jgi:outer membrane protein TolC
MLQTEAAAYNSSAAKSDWYPQIFAFGNYQYSNPNQRYLPVKDEFNDSWDVGISLQWSLWDWGGRSAKSEQARQQEIQVESSYALLKETIQTEVRKNYLNLLNQKQRLIAGKLYQESAQENYRTSNEKYNVQLITSTELIDAEVSLHEAKTVVETAKADYEIARIRLLKSVGRKIY